MRLFISAVVLTLVLIPCIVSADQSAVTDLVKKMQGLIAYYPLEGDYKDASGNGLHGQQVGDPLAFEWTDGVNGGKAIIINSAKYVGSFIDIPAPIGSPFDTPTASAVVWVKLFAREGNYWQAIAERSNLWYLEAEVKPAEWKNNAVVFRIYDPVNVGGGGSGQVRDNVNATIENDKWYQLAFTYDGKVLKGYINGKQVLTKEYSLADGSSGLGPNANTPAEPPQGKGKNYNLSLGTWQQRDDWFYGAIDDFAYFKVALTDAQIVALYEAMLAGPSSVKPTDKIATKWGEMKAR